MEGTITKVQWRCRRCGCEIAGDHADDLFCSPCQRELNGYDPRHDPDLEAKLLDLLRARRGREVDVYRALGIDGADQAHRNCVAARIRRLRRHGHLITGRGGRLCWQGQEAA